VIDAFQPTLLSQALDVSAKIHKLQTQDVLDAMLTAFVVTIQMQLF
jgi:hypothetical protein